MAQLSWILEIPQWAAATVSTKTGVTSEDSAGEESAFKMVMDRIQFHGGCWHEGLSCLLTGVQKLPPNSYHVGLSNILTNYTS